MTDWEASLAACLLQVALVTAVALGLLGRVRQWNGSERLRLCQAAFAGVLLLSLLAIIRPLPGDWPGRMTVASSATNSGRETTVSVPSTEADSTANRGVMISWSQLQDMSRSALSLLGARTAQAAWPRWRWWVVAPVALLATLATVRLSLAARRLHTLWRTSRPLTDDSPTAELESLQQRYGLRSPVLLRETSALSQAAVIGWRRPVILLPGDWRDWSAAELRLVLAHELAHIRQGDLRWRWLAEVVLVLHACQPLVYWLHRRLVLEQELAADRTAAEACGGAAAYLKTLSTLALRCDIRPERTTLAPVLTGLLLRRVEMLQTREGRTVSTTRLWNWIRPAALCAAIALACGLQLPAAEEPEELGDGKASRVVTAEATERPLSEPAAAFSRKIEAPLVTPHADGGLLEVHLKEFLSGPAGKVITADLRRGVLDEMFENIDEMIGQTGAAIVRTVLDAIVKNDVETIAADMHIMLAYRPDTPDDHKHQLSLGARSLRVQMKVSGELTAGLPADADAVLQFRGISYVPVSTDVFTSPDKPLRMCAAYPDPGTLVLVFGEEELKHVFPAQPAVLSPNAARLRRSVGGGVLTMVLPAASLKRHNLNDSDEPGDKIANDLLQHAEAAALGVDITPGNRLAVRLRCCYPNAEQARAAEQQAQALARLAQDALSKVGTIIKVENNVQKPVDGGVTFYRELLANHKLSVEVQPDGTADLVFESSGSHWFEQQ